MRILMGLGEDKKGVSHPASTYRFGVADRGRSVEVERVAEAQLTIDHLPLLVKPAPRSFVPPLQNDMVTLEATRQIIPG